MTLPNTYANLQTVVLDTTNRQDLTAQLPTFIRMAEHDLQRQLRVPDMIQRSTATLVEQWSPLPGTFLEMHSLTWVSPLPGGAMEYLSPEEFRERTYENYTGTTRYFTIVGTELGLLPAPGTDGATLEMVYYEQIPNLSDDQTTNWLLNKHPDLYLYATCLQTAPYLIDDDRVGLWGQIKQGILDSINAAGERAVRPRTKLLARPRRAY